MVSEFEILTYGSTLKIFHSEVSFVKSIMNGLSLLRNLNTLGIEKAPTPEEESLDLLQALTRAKNITNLRLALDFSKDSGSEGLNSLAHLESLAIIGNTYDDESISNLFDLSEFKKLAKLFFFAIDISVRPMCYTTLQELSWHVWDTSEETLQKLALLSNLRRISFETPPKIPSFVFENWKELRFLMAPFYTIDDDFFLMIAKLPNLEYLGIHGNGDKTKEEQFRSKICLLISLRTLVFSGIPVDLLTPMPEGSFPRLRVLRCNQPIPDDTRKELFGGCRVLLKLKP